MTRLHIACGVALCLTASLSDADETTDRPELLAPGVISSPLFERDTSLSADGNTLFYTLQLNRRGTIVSSQRQDDGRWSAPVVASFSGQYSDLEAFLAPDGQRLFFASNRPLDSKSSQTKDYDLWMVDKTSSGWGQPRHLGPTINSTGNEFYPSVSADGTLYFTATLEHGVGGEDIYVASWNGTAYAAPTALATTINSEGDEFNAYVSADGQMLIFSSIRRSDGHGGGDLYISRRDDHGDWRQAKVLPTPINSPALDFCPHLSADGQWFYWTSTRQSPTPPLIPGQGLDRLKTWLNQPLNGQGNLYKISADLLSVPGQP